MSQVFLVLFLYLANIHCTFSLISILICSGLSWGHTLSRLYNLLGNSTDLINPVVIHGDSSYSYLFTLICLSAKLFTEIHLKMAYSELGPVIKSVFNCNDVSTTNLADFFLPDAIKP